ncbi:LysR family transcriptional regulator [Pseudoalteromonas aliena]|uniref:LysR family transcriptional regulator n=1 Tax=Pseudoalteromonas aliena TaxID=247523 RepID=UPI0024943742|nr:LysR substrate-binding domain-containing protein [Pseudoalteromonas aliena]
MNQLRHMSIFAHIVETGSITNAAEALQLSKSVVSQHLKLLEQELGVLLIKRTTRKHILTNEGEAFYQSCREMNKIADIAWKQAKNSVEVPQGSIKITAPNALMDVVIAPAVGDLLKKYPLLKPELISGDDHLNLMSDNIDLAIRVGRSQTSNIKQRRIGQFRDVLCGRHNLVTQGDINNAMYIANTWQGKRISHEFSDNQGKLIVFEATAQCRSNSFYSCLALIKEGAGIGLIPDFQLSSVEPALVEVFPHLTLPINHVYALYPYEKHLPLSVKVCIDAIANKLDKFSKR